MITAEGIRDEFIDAVQQAQGPDYVAIGATIFLCAATAVSLGYVCYTGFREDYRAWKRFWNDYSCSNDSKRD